MSRNLIVARMDPGHAQKVAETFARSDRSGLPAEMGVTGRHLFRFRGLYLHLLEAHDDFDERIRRARQNESFRQISQELDPYISAYDPATWRGPNDALAEIFYSWNCRSEQGEK